MNIQYLFIFIYGPFKLSELRLVIDRSEQVGKYRGYLFFLYI